MSIQYNPAAEMITSDQWLEIVPCYTTFERCDSVQININEDQVDVDVDRIPALITALEKAYQLAMGLPQDEPAA